MSDGMSFARRDSVLGALVSRAIRLWYCDEDYSRELDKMCKIRGGCYWPHGACIARDLKVIFDGDGSKRSILVDSLEMDEEEIDDMIGSWGE